MKDFQYYGLFLSQNTRDELLKQLMSESRTADMLYKADKIFLDHCTLMHRSQLQDSPEMLDYLQSRIGDNVAVKIVAIGASPKAMAFKVELHNSTMCANKTPHITIATFDGGKPVDSNKIIYWSELKPVKVIMTTLDKR